MKKQCACGSYCTPYWDCPLIDGTPEARQYVRGGWHFAQGQNPARREAFFKRAAEDPFGVSA